MQSSKIFTPWLALVGLVALSGCGSSDDPYARLKNPPLITARLHAVTLVSDARAVMEAAAQAGWRPARLPPNYQQADAVQASMWGVPVSVAAAVAHFKAASPGAPDVLVLQMPLAARGRVAEAATNRSWFRNVLGTEVPAWPLPGKQPDNVRVQVWTYAVPSVVAASKRLRENGIPVTFDPVAITTAYLGDHKTMAIRAPDGTVVQLVEAASQ